MLFAGWEVRMVKTCDRGLETHPDPNPSSYNLESTFKSMGHLFLYTNLPFSFFVKLTRNFKLDLYRRVWCEDFPVQNKP